MEAPLLAGAMGFQDWMYFGVSVLQLGIAVLLLIVPLRPNGVPQRHWLAIWPNFAAGTAGVLLTIVKVWDLDPVLRALILSVAYASLAAIFGIFIWVIVRVSRNTWQGTQRPQPASLNATTAESNASQRLAPDMESEIRAVLSTGRKIEAIRRVRKMAGMGLKEAKDYVDALEAHNYG